MNDKARSVAVLWFLILVNYFDRSAISFAGPTIMGSLDMSPAAFGMILSSFGVGYALALVPGGLIADRFGTRMMLIVAPVFWGFFTGATGLVTTFAGFMIARFGLGCAEGAFSPAIFKSIGDHFESRQRAFALAICLTALTLGPALAGPIVGSLVSAYGWQTMFLLMAVPALVAALSAYLFFPKANPATSKSNETRGEQDRLKYVLKRPSLWLLSLTNLLTDIGQWGFLSWLPTYLVLERHIDVKAAGMVGSIPYIFACIGLLLGGWLGSSFLHRFRAQLAAFCYFGTAMALGLAYLAVDLIWAVTGLSVAAFLLFAAGVSKGAVAIDLAPPQSRGSYIAFYNVAGQIGGASAPAIIGFLVHATGNFASGFGFMAGALAMAALCLVILGGMTAPDRSYKHAVTD